MGCCPRMLPRAREGLTRSKAATVEPPTRPVPPSTRTRFLPPSFPEEGGARSSAAALMTTCRLVAPVPCVLARRVHRGQLGSHRLSGSRDRDDSAVRSLALLKAAPRKAGRGRAVGGRNGVHVERLASERSEIRLGAIITYTLIDTLFQHGDAHFFKMLINFLRFSSDVLQWHF